jgi:hypothetical protein
MRDIQFLGELVQRRLEVVQFGGGFLAVQAKLALGAFLQFLELGAEVLERAQRRDVIQLERYPYLVVQVLRGELAVQFLTEAGRIGRNGYVSPLKRTRCEIHPRPASGITSPARQTAGAPPLVRGSV